MAQKLTDDEFIRLWKELKGATAVAKKAGLSIRACNLRRRRIERKYGNALEAEDPRAFTAAPRHHGRAFFRIQNGTILIGSDAHYWPGIISTAHRAFVYFCRELRPTAVVMNGDAFDGAGISRFPSIGWQDIPSVEQELEAVDARLTEIQKAAGHHNLFWSLGNHDMRYESTIANRLPEFRGRKSKEAFSLKTHFPDWKPCWALWVNDDTVIKHRWKGGVHAGLNNARDGGVNFFTGHDHMLKVNEWGDYRGVRYGVQTGFLAQIGGAQFTDYTEDNPVQWGSGFIVATWWNGRLLTPEKVRVIDEEKGLVEFRGRVHTV